MKTFLGFTTGALLGIIGGSFGLILLILTNKDLREFIDEQSIDD